MVLKSLNQSKNRLLYLQAFTIFSSKKTIKTYKDHHIDTIVKTRCEENYQTI